MTQQKAVVERYTDGFRTGDLEKILSCLTDDVVWELPGAKTLVGKSAFAAEADSAGGPNPQLTLDRLVEEGDTVAVLGHGSGEFGNSDPVDFIVRGGVHVHRRSGQPAGHLPRLARRGSRDVIADFDRHCAEIVAQTRAVDRIHRTARTSAVPVPTCPGWNVSQLLRHVDGGLRWAREIVATARLAPPPRRRAARPVRLHRRGSGLCCRESLTEAAEQLAATLTEAGPDAQMWCPVDGGGAAFYARRFTHETAIHRADAALRVRRRVSIWIPMWRWMRVDEWLELGCLPFHFEVHPWMRELLGTGSDDRPARDRHRCALAARFHRRRDRVAPVR